MKSNLQKRKLTKKELKEINGGNGPTCVTTCFCNNDGELYIGACDAKGVCC
ncbi:bacteriocin [Chryseobacterium lathyri]|uniref:Bacteriocin-like protein n=1 Tax=Chryseobacterium lathyri TaxID=395933 RepID=A0ABT9SHG1_9FLAO|nr:bacteriocin [Chryseobacterium lathyri]MDP9958708.1 bacteriocin-like protein [Chryseobacterium lathyri]